MKQIVFLLTLLFTMSATSQTVTQLFACGSAVPEGVVELTRFPDGTFKFAGALQQGELFLRTTETHKASAYYVKPKYEDSYLINHGLPFTLARDTTSSWYVPVSEERYRFTVNVSSKTLTGELFTPWIELFMVGGATDIGWESYIMLPFTRDESEICAWSWTGELRNHPEHNESRRFKILGQNAWEPKALHPFTQDENVLKSQYLLTGGTADNKWQTTSEGIYEIHVDVFRETIRATFLGSSSHATDPTSVDAPITDVPQSAHRYNLAGQEVGPTYRGITIINGKKYIKH